MHRVKPSAVGESRRHYDLLACTQFVDGDRSILTSSRRRCHDYVVVDVRDRSGWSGGHIPGSIHVPINHLDAT